MSDIRRSSAHDCANKNENVWPQTDCYYSIFRIFWSDAFEQRVQTSSRISDQTMNWSLSYLSTVVIYHKC